MRMKPLFLAMSLTAFAGAALAYTPGTYKAAYPGMAGPVPVSVTFSKTKIEKIEIGEEKETPGLGKTAIKLLPPRIIASQSIGIDGVSGASLTSAAIFKGVADCVKQAGGDVAAVSKKAAAKPAAAGPAKTVSTDLVVLGGGGAGMIAALNASERGLNVVLLEKMTFLGGASTICGGIVIVQGSQLQKKLGDKGDSPSKMAFDLLANGHQRNDLNALTFYADNVGKSIDWIMGKGVKFSDEYSFRAEHKVPRTVFLKGGCPAYGQTLRDLIAKSKVKVMLSTRATEIIMKNGRAAGAKAVMGDGTPLTVNAKAVLLATGGYGYNKDMLTGSLKNALYYGPVSSTGDGQKMAEKAGAAMQMMDLGKIYPQGIESAPGIAKSTLQGNIGAYDEAGILVDLKGNRVVNEKGTGVAIKAQQLKQPNATLFLALDPKSFEGFKKRMFISGVSESDVEQWLANNGSKPPLFVKGKTLEEACKIAGIDAKNLRETIKRYNGYVKSGKDLEFDRPARFMKKTVDADGEFYIVEQKPRFATTLGGVVVTTKLEVKDTKGNVIPGLYAAGEMVNSVHGDDSTPGANVGWGITSGKAVSDVIADAIQKK